MVNTSLALLLHVRYSLKDKSMLLTHFYLMHRNKTTWFVSPASINPIEDTVQRGPLGSFSPVTSTNVGISPQNFLTFNFNPFTTPSSSSKLLNFDHEHHAKKNFFRSNSYKIEVMIIFHIEMPELPNFGHTTTSTT